MQTHAYSVAELKGLTAGACQESRRPVGKWMLSLVGPGFCCVLAAQNRIRTRQVKMAVTLSVFGEHLLSAAASVSSFCLPSRTLVLPCPTFPRLSSRGRGASAPQDGIRQCGPSEVNLSYNQPRDSLKWLPAPIRTHTVWDTNDFASCLNPRLTLQMAEAGGSPGWQRMTR